MIRKFLDYIAIERHYSPLTVQAYEQDLTEFCSFLHLQPETFNPALVTDDDIRDWMISLMEQTAAKPRTVRRKLSSLRSFWKFLLRVGYVEVDVTRNVIAPKVDKPLPVFFKEQEMQAARRAMDYADDFESLRDSLVIDILYQTGMRRAELVNLTDGDIDFSAMSVRVFGKRRKERVVPFGQALADRIRAYQTLRNDTFDLTPSPHQPLIVNNRGQAATLYTIYSIVRTRMGEVSSLKKHSPHVLRHTFATEMLNNGADINTIKTLLGHANLAATQIYTHTTFDQLKSAYLKAHPRAKK